MYLSGIEIAYFGYAHLGEANLHFCFTSEARGRRLIRWSGFSALGHWKVNPGYQDDTYQMVIPRMVGEDIPEIQIFS